MNADKLEPGQACNQRPLNPDFPLNHERCRNADIFYNNCFKNSIFPIVLDEKIIDNLFADLFATPGYQLTVDLERQLVVTPDGAELAFAVGTFRKDCLLHGLDDIDLTLQSADAIRAYEKQWQAQSPWLFGALGRTVI